jgi:hypothetical protein
MLKKNFTVVTSHTSSPEDNSMWNEIDQLTGWLKEVEDKWLEVQAILSSRTMILLEPTTFCTA